MAFVALVAALSGTSVALPGKNNVDSGDIKNGQVKSSDIRNNGVRGRDIARDTVSGTDVNEGSLGTVPSAATAATAANAGSARTAASANFATRAGTLATLELQGQNDEIVSALDADSPNAASGLPNCPAGTNVEVNSFDVSANGLDDDPFYIQFNL